MTDDDALSTRPSREFIAYRTMPDRYLPIVPAASRRDWMDSTLFGAANRCLPLLMGNQSGWVVLNTHRIQFTWTGGDGVAATSIEVLEGTTPSPVESHFGSGIVTWIIPYLFRTPRGYNLLVRGPANYPKDGACALDGVVETDWSVAPFTMSWKLTRPNLPVIFAIGEPICMLLPQRRGELEEFAPSFRDLTDERHEYEGLVSWARGRAGALQQLHQTTASATPEQSRPEFAWEKHYFRGTAPDGRFAPDHQMKLRLRRFDSR